MVTYTNQGDSTRSMELTVHIHSHTFILVLQSFHRHILFSVILDLPICFVDEGMNKRLVTCRLATTLVTRVGKKSFYTHFAPPHPDAMLTKHFHLTQVCILPFSNIDRGNGDVDTSCVDITFIRWFPHNIRAIMAKIKLPEKPRGTLLFWSQLIRTYRDLSSQADPARENWTWRCPYFT